MTKTMGRVAWWMAVVAVIGVACSDRSPLAPARAEQRPGAATEVLLSGWVYARADAEDPPLAEARVRVRASDGTIKTVMTDAAGFYEVVVRSGAVSITASREGYEAKTWRLRLLNDTVLNFGLTPR